MSEKNIHTAILGVMSDIEYLQKEKKAGVAYTVKSESGVLRLLRPAMIKHEIIMYPSGVKDICHSEVEVGKYKNIWQRMVAVHCYRFVHAPSGTFIDVEVLGEGADTNDKAANKTMTVSKKYALLEAFLLITGDDPGDTQSPVGNFNQSAQATPAARQWTQEQVKAVVDSGAAKNDFNARAILNRSNITDFANNPNWCAWYAKMYRKATEEGLSKDDSFIKANNAYLEATKEK